MAPEDRSRWQRAGVQAGRIVTVTNDTVFDEPVYNYTREFPFIWDGTDDWLASVRQLCCTS